MEEKTFNLGKYTQCPACNWEWACKSKRRFIKCSNCYKTIKNPHAPNE